MFNTGIGLIAKECVAERDLLSTKQAIEFLEEDVTTLVYPVDTFDNRNFKLIITFGLSELENEQVEITGVPVFTASDSTCLLKKTIRCPLELDELISVLLHCSQLRNDADYTLVGCSRSEHLISMVSPTNSTVLLTGETGVGKEVAARKIHLLSKNNGHFVPVNCGSIPRDLIESELFGHEKGAFTGALSSRQGRVEMAEGGTLFLDEIGDMPYSMQVKLLRFLQERSYVRVGGTKEKKANVRVIAATHRDLELMVANGEFREDLYYRLCVFPIPIPSLKERAEEIPALISQFQAQLFSKKVSPIHITGAAMRALCRYEWPGNIRELQNVIELLSIKYPRMIVGPSQLPFLHQPQENTVFKLNPQLNTEAALQDDRDFLNDIFASVAEECHLEKAHNIEEQFCLKSFIEDIEKDYIEIALKQTNYVVSKSSKLLMMNRTTLVEKMKKYDIHRPPHSE